MRLAVALCLLALPVRAWEFTPAPVCTLSHETADAAVTVTWDPRRPEPYAIAVTRGAPWAGAPVFAMRFDGPRGNMIVTDRHAVSDGGRTLTVTDRGFGNVLDGLEFNDSATALLGDEAVPFPLEGAAGPVRAFRACAEAATV
jgi:hypothetical protein